MMKNVLVLLTVILLYNSSYGQPAPQNWNWYFGGHAAVNFSTGSPVAVSGSAMSAYEGSASISDTAGNLLFYTEGVKVWNRNNLVMPNGTGLLSSFTFTQAALIVPKPDSANIYYIFSPGFQGHYSEVDMTLNGGLGDVTVKNALLHDSTDEKLVAIKHHNGNDYWVIVHQFYGSSFYVYLVSNAGVSGPVISNLGTDTLGYAGYLKASPCGHRLVAASLGNLTTNGGILYDFNTSTGSISNPISIPDSNGFYGASFSPDNSKVYFHSGNQKIYQYDLSSYNQATIIASRFIVDTSVYYTALQLGPDHKIYLRGSVANSLAVINNPNIGGAGCNYVGNAVNIGSGTFMNGLPNIIDAYDTINMNCANETVGIINNSNVTSISLYPNPTTGTFTLSYHLSTPDAAFQLLDISGRVVYKHSISGTIGNEIIDASALSSGIYFWQLTSPTETWQGKVVIAKSE